MGSRLAAVATLAVLVLGSLYLADALTSRLRAETGLTGLGAGREEALGAVGRGGQAGPASLPDPIRDLEEALSGEGAGRRLDGRQWMERFVGSHRAADDPVPPPPGAWRLLRMPGGITWYRLGDGDPEERMRAAAEHYRQAFLAGGWRVMTDRAYAAGGAGQAARRGPAHLLLADRAGATVAVFLEVRAGVASALVRNLSDRG